MGVVKIKKGEPIHIANWMVVAGANASLGTDTKRGVEIAVDDIGGKILGHPIKITTQDTGCNAEGGQAAATKLASDPDDCGGCRLQLLERSQARRSNLVEGWHSHGIAFQHGPLLDRPETRTRVDTDTCARLTTIMSRAL